MLKAAEGIADITNIVDGLTVKPAAVAAAVAPAPAPSIVKPKPLTVKAAENDGFSLSQALAKKRPRSRRPSSRNRTTGGPTNSTATASVCRGRICSDCRTGTVPGAIPGEIMPAAAMELSQPQSSVNDQQLVQSVSRASNQAKTECYKVSGWTFKAVAESLNSTGRAGSRDAQRHQILEIVSNTPGVVGVREQIQINAANTPFQTASDLRHYCQNLCSKATQVMAAIRN